MWSRQNTNVVCYLGIIGLLLSYKYGNTESKKHRITATTVQVSRFFIRLVLVHVLSGYTYGGAITVILYFYVHVVWAVAFITGINDKRECNIGK